MNPKLFIICLLVSVFSGCSNTSNKLGIYYWKLDGHISSASLNFLKEANVDEVYLHLFDIDLIKNIPTPIAKQHINLENFKQQEVIPVIFIRNQVFNYCTKNELEQLALNVDHLIADYETQFNGEFKSLQIDCDWSINTKDNYFEWIKMLKKYRHSIVVTLRLHQAKYPKKTGIPPVDRAVLMVYNVLPLDVNSQFNSIFNTSTVKKYIASVQNYPLPLDIALPLYSWGIVQHLDGRKELINNLYTTDIDAVMFECKVEEANIYIAKKEVLFRNVYFYKGDKVKIEGISKTNLESAIGLLNNNLKQNNRSIVFFHLDDAIINHYDVKQIQSIYSTIH